MKAKPILITGGLAFAMLLLTTWPAQAQPMNDRLGRFQKFVNGEIPVKQGLMLRTLSNANGKVLNREWWRFGCQDDTWYVERVVPDTNNPLKFVSAAWGTVCGASTTRYWSISDQNIHLVDRDKAVSSGPESFGEFSRSLLSSGLALGLPRRHGALEFDEIEWNGLAFTTTVGSKWDKRGTILATMVITGKLALGENGLPISAECPGAGQLPASSVTYEYGQTNKGIPSIFVEKITDHTYRYEFLSLTLGRNDLVGPDGYVPSMFGDMKIKRDVTVWTNSYSYSVINGKLQPNFGITLYEPGKIRPWHRRFIIASCTFAVVAIILGLWYWRSKARS